LADAQSAPPIVPAAPRGVNANQPKRLSAKIAKISSGNGSGAIINRTCFAAK
jgi:hypothetical protein